MGIVARVCQPSTFRMLICPEASSAQNNIAAVSADGSTVCVLILRLNSSCNRSMAFVVRTLRHWLGGSQAVRIPRSLHVCLEKQLFAARPRSVRRNPKRNCQGQY